MSESNFKTPDFKKIAEEVLKDLPKNAGEKARTFFLSSFTKEGFTDTSFIPWPKRKDDLSHKILSQSYQLKDSIKITKMDMQSVEITAGEGLKYAAIHNDGGTIVVTVTEKMRKYFWYMYKKTEDEKWKFMALTKNEKLSIKIPQRQFIGESYELSNRLDQMFIKSLMEAEKKIKF
ncbi:phage virion morphogenesis protein [Soonwooa sp.]|uniref:phage virion morphogenesis protein n=1 Tax=Soonwooa sp. TaxID=1938592 RepID=UPI0028A763DA|nr:phage virion morphogenesis protein [Soonwooa sp.]